MEELEALRDTIRQAVMSEKIDAAGNAIAKAVPLLLNQEEELGVPDEIDNSPPIRHPLHSHAGSVASDPPSTQPTSQSSAGAHSSNQAGSKEPQGQPTSSTSAQDNASSSSDSSGDGSDSDSDSEDGEAYPVNSYRYRSTMHLPRNPRLDHMCAWLYDTVVNPDWWCSVGSEPEEASCQKLSAAIMAAWRTLHQQEEEKHQAQQQAESSGVRGQADGRGHQGAASCSSGSLSSSPLPPTEALHLQHAPFSAPFCTWRRLAPGALPPLHDVLAGVLRLAWERHEDRDPARNVIWGAQRASRRDDPVSAYMYVEYLRLLLEAITESGAEPLWLWHELQEIIEEYAHWRHHPHEVAVLARMCAEAGCGQRLINSLAEHIGKAPLLMYGAWAALWDGLRRGEALACVRLAGRHGVAAEAVWGHVAELTLLQVKEHPHDAKLSARAVAVLSKALELCPAPAELAAVLAAERDAPGACEGVRRVTSQLAL